MFSSSEPLEFTLDEDDKAALSGDDEYTGLLRRARGEMFAALQDRRLPVVVCLFCCVVFFCFFFLVLELEQPHPGVQQEYPDIFTPEEVSRLLGTLSAMESINQEWADTLERLTQRQEELLEALPEFLGETGGEWRYEHIAVYFLYRHFTVCLPDGAVYARSMVACCPSAAVMLMYWMLLKDSGALSEWDRILDLKLYSKQVEYSEENTAEFIAEYD